MNITLDKATLDYFQFLFGSSREVLKAASLGVKVEMDEGFISNWIHNHAKSAYKSKKESMRKSALAYAGVLMERGLSKDEAYKRAGIATKGGNAAKAA